MRKKPILLAPAGSLDALKAAVFSGADAVYFGGGRFNARAFATNFGDEDIEKAFAICRLYGVKVYITLNTLLSDKELPKALEFVETLEKKFRPDAYIVQDLGLISALRGSFPDIPLHASTQMQLHSSHCASVLKRYGVSRVVLARELSREDIKKVTECGLETEIFVHGAICVCQSGGCLMSSFIGGRSGNRGKCAQPCRQPYGGKYALSLKDMCLASYIPEICDMGVDCLKIEGRMKSPEYVYETVRIYRGLIDNKRVATREELSRLSALFSRSGFTDGYYTSRRGPCMFGVRTETDKEKSRALTVDIKEKKLPIAITCVITEGESSYIKASLGKLEAEYRGDSPQKAINRPITRDDLAARLSKTGDTAFSVETIDITLDEGLIMPISAINALRRCVLDRLTEIIISANTPKRDAQRKEFVPIADTVHSTGRSQTVVRFEGKAPSEKLLKALIPRCDRIELPLWVKRPDIDYGDKLSLVLPRAVYDSDTHNVKLMLQEAYNSGIRHITVPNIGMLPLCEGFTLHGDYPLNVTNTLTAKQLELLGFESCVISAEIAPKAIAHAVVGGEYVVYGKAPLMHTENCIIQNIGKCIDKTYCKGVLTDKTGARFAVLREYGHRNTIYNSVPTYLLDKRDELGEVSSCVLFFTDEDEDRVIEILNAYEKGLSPNGVFTRAALKRGTGVF